MKKFTLLAGAAVLALGLTTASGAHASPRDPDTGDLTTQQRQAINVNVYNTTSVARSDVRNIGSTQWWSN